MITKSIRHLLIRPDLMLAAALALGHLTSLALYAEEPPMALAAAALQRGDLAAAESLLVPLTSGTPSDPGALALLAQVRTHQGRPKDAVELIDRALGLAPDNARLHAALGRALSECMPKASMAEQPMFAGRMLEAFQTAVSIDPDLIEARVGLARYYTNAPEIAGGSRARAEEQARQIQQRVPWLGEAELGQIALKFGEPAAARDHLAKADTLNPGQAWLLELRGHAAAALGEFSAARAHYEAALAANPGSATARAALAKLPPQSG